MFEPGDVVERPGHCDDIVPSLACIVRKQHGVHGGKYLLKTPGNTISETLNFKMALDASAPRPCGFGASSKAACNSLSACYLKTFRQPWLPQCYGHASLFMIRIIYLVGILVIHRWYAYKSGEPAIGQNTFHVTHVCDARSLLQPVQCG